MESSDATLLTDLRHIVGDGHVLTDGAETEPYLTDWRGRYRGRARAIVRPRDTREVSAVIARCAAARVAVVPQGGNTGMCGGATPDTSGRSIVLSLVRMNRVRGVDVDNATMTVEAGVPLAQVQQSAAGHGMMFPLSLGSEGSCTIGGNLSTNAGGTSVLRYGNARDLTLGVEVVLADGRVFDGLRGLRKDNTGYDLKQLFIGGEGTLGIVTAAVLKLFPAPHTRITAFVAIADVPAAVALLRRLKQALSDRLVGFELISGFALSLSLKHHPDLSDPLPGHPWYVLVQADDSAHSPLGSEVESALAAAADSGIVADAAVAQSGEQAMRMWALRENISESQRREGPNVKHDISLPVSAITRFLPEAEAALAGAFPGARLVVFGHLGDGNLHYNLAAPPGADAQKFMEHAPEVNRIVHDLVHQYGGSISAEHGIGQQKRDDLRRYKGEVEIELMERIKRALDPAGLLNPGKVL